MKSKLVIAVLCFVSASAMAESYGGKSRSNDSNTASSGPSKSSAFGASRSQTASATTGPSGPSGIKLVSDDKNYGRDPCLSNYKCRAKFY